MSARSRVRLLLLLLSGSAMAQEWTAQLRHGSELLQRRQFDAARTIFEEVRDQAMRSGTELAEAGALMGLGNIEAEQSQYPPALNKFQRAAELYERNPGPIANRWVLVAYGQIAAMSYYLGDRAKAVEFARKRFAGAQKYGQPAALGLALYSLAYYESDLQIAVEYLKQGLEAAASAGDTATQGALYHLWSDHLWVAGRYNEAQQKLTSALAILDRPGTELDLARALTSQGRLDRTYSRYEKALKSYSQAMQIQEKIGDADGVRQSLQAMAVSLDRLGRSAEAAAQLKRALALARASGSPGQIASALKEMAVHFYSRGEFRRAVPVLEEAARLAPEIAIIWDDLAYGLIKENRSVEALAAANHALQLPGAASIRDSALLERADALHRLGRWSEAREDVRSAVRGMEEERTHLSQDDESRIGFAEEHGWFYNRAVPVVAEIDPAEALAVAERARARAFLDLLATREVDAEANSPGLREAVRIEPYRVDQVAALARRLGSTVVLYWLADRELLIWVVRPSGLVCFQKVAAGWNQITALVKQAADSSGDSVLMTASGDRTSGSAPPTQADPWSQLYRYLIQPVEAYLPKAEGSLLSIVPHGPLFRVPFAALRDSRGLYLVERYSFHYAPAAAVLDGHGKQRGPYESALVVANPAHMPPGPDGEALPPLPGTIREARAITRILSHAEVLEGPQATTEAVSAASRGRSVIHLATHSVLLEDQPFDSFLALSGERLEARDIYHWNLSADLVALSSCRSAAGRISAEGMISITRAFLYAGASSVLATLWDVPDTPTVELMKSFYGHYEANHHKAKALRGAQLEVLHELHAGKLSVKTAAGEFALPESPLFWAPFAIYGQP